MKKAVIFFADGLEECEGLIVVDILRRAKMEVVVASVSGKKDIVSSHNVRIMADALAEEVNYDDADIVILPGGKVGTENLSKNSLVAEKCRTFAGSKMVAAICAAPSVLAALGLLEGKQSTCYPSFEEKMQGAVLTHGSVAVSDNIITGQGLGAAIPFALEIVKQLVGPEMADHIRDSICSPM